MEDNKIQDHHYFLGSWFDQGKESFSYFHIHPIASVDGKTDSPFATKLIQASYELDAYDGQGVPGEEGFYTYGPIGSKDCIHDSLEPQHRLNQLIYDQVFHSLTMNHGFDAGVKQSGNHQKFPIIISPTLTHLDPILKAWNQARNQINGTTEPPHIIYLGAKAQLGNTLDPHEEPGPLGAILKTFAPTMVQIGVRSWSTFDLLTQSLFSIKTVGARALMMAGNEAELRELVAQLFPDQLDSTGPKSSKTILLVDGDGLDPSIWLSDNQALGQTLPGGLSYYTFLSVLEILTQLRSIDCLVVTHSSTRPNSLVMADLTHKMLGFLSRSPLNNPELRLSINQYGKTPPSSHPGGMK